MEIYYKQYWKALREMIHEAHKITGAKKVPKHLRVAVISHAQHLARVRVALKQGGSSV